VTSSRVSSPGGVLCLSNEWAILVDPHKALSYQRALVTFTRIVGEADSAQRLLQNATAQIARITDIRNVKALRYRPDKGDLLIEAGVGWKPGVVGHVTFGADRHSSPGRSLQTGAPVVCEDIRNERGKTLGDPKLPAFNAAQQEAAVAGLVEGGPSRNGKEATTRAVLTS
jgi:hypothetical protein